ncbi:MAG TPA: hypothetical protein VLE99_06540 [Candidatus Saccharimonadales bacterium]|nr:hypothetical protein [Candidatus Saccharimonadales bacterium]
MKILLEFSRGTLETHADALEHLRQLILRSGHSLTNDLVEDSRSQANLLPDGVYGRLQRAVAEAQCVIIEGSVVSVSIGVVLSEALRLGKPVLFLVHTNDASQRNRFPAVIASKLVTHKMYSDNYDLGRHLTAFIKHRGSIKRRFNLVLPNELDSYVIMQSRRRGISKTEYITGLIEASRQGS